MAKDAPFNNPFAALQSQRDALPAGAPPALAAEKTPSHADRRAVVRLERKGHGGKEMTRVTHFAIDADEAGQLLTTLKHKLGCGGVQEGAELLLQGDQRERLRQVLVAMGVRRITVG